MHMPQEKKFYVYMMASPSGTLYLGMTNDIIRRCYEHRNRLFAGFSKQYGCSKLVYFEACPDACTALNREKQIKKWNRGKKLFLIRQLNPGWRDLWDSLF